MVIVITGYISYKLWSYYMCWFPYISVVLQLIIFTDRLIYYLGFFGQMGYLIYSLFYLTGTVHIDKDWCKYTNQSYPKGYFHL